MNLLMKKWYGYKKMQVSFMINNAAWHLHVECSVSQALNKIFERKAW